ncbi:HTH-type transcriptional regulator IscR [Hartmannibacter diazotrophicus]|uniref:HTH-type transcriptional regulator IscR n=1 Tax=Hartmannibacter diazotrophicus TaxID=1482074 RepID=A0A2C9DDJ8_9HYPH|nr:Rrf2 family transcriptional regulator [Hartmannibacter diazotrophicus]SON58377.1 HTH-type transcriptional regulator IscR [Hartmannibacter diazotrophicus]
MKLGDGVEAAIHCCAVLAGTGQDATISAGDLAEHHGVSASYLVKHLKRLVAEGILESVPGPAGGYRLGRAAEAITLADIVLAVEGREPAFRCANIRRRGPSPLPDDAYLRPCGIAAAMLSAERAYREALQKTRLSDLVTEFLETSDPRVLERGCAFVERARRPQPASG